MKNIAKFLALGVFAASTTLVAHADPIVGSINFSGYTNSINLLPGNALGVGGCAVGNMGGFTAACYSGGYFVLPSAATGTSGPTGFVLQVANATQDPGENLTDYFSAGAGTTLYNTNNSPSDPTINFTQTGTATFFQPAGTGFAITAPGATSGGVLIASATDNGETLQFYVTSSNTSQADTNDTAGKPEVSINGGGYLEEFGVNNTFTNSYATYSIDSNGDLTITFGGQVQSAPSPAPEPSSLMLLGTGLASAAGMVFRRRRTVA
jgi:PEP-CTERM motif